MEVILYCNNSVCHIAFKCIKHFNALLEWRDFSGNKSHHLVITAGEVITLLLD